MNVIFTAPIAYRAMTPLLSDADISSLRLCVSAGETLPATVWNAWHEATGLKILDGIGSTELLHSCITNRIGDAHAGATGRPVTGYEAKIVTEEMEDAKPGEIGLLVVRGPTGCRYLADKRQAAYIHS